MNCWPIYGTLVLSTLLTMSGCNSVTQSELALAAKSGAAANFYNRIDLSKADLERSLSGKTILSK